MSPLLRESPLSQELLAKYQQLLLKHEALVRRLEARNDEHLSTRMLSAWGLETTASGLALLRDGTIQVANRRWYALAGSSALWREFAREKALPRLLRDVARAESHATLGELGPRVTRYLLEGGDQVLELRTDLIPGQPGSPPRVLVLALDISEQVKAEQELARVRESLTQREHLRGLGEMAAGVVHDLNGTLNAMILRLELIGRDAAFAERQRDNLEALMRIVQDAHGRVRKLSNFARQQSEPVPDEPVQLATVVREAMDTVRGELEHRAAQEGVRLHLDVQVEPLPLVRGSALDLRYVLINLMLNARDAMPHGGTLRVRGHETGGQVVLYVADEGTGIPEQHLRDIFRPFFTTKGSKGTGLGLSMAYGVVSRVGGTLTATNLPRRGALFTLTFPRLASREDSLPSHRSPPRTRRAPRRKRSQRG